MEVLASVLDPELAEVDIAAIEKLASGTDIQDIDAAAESCELQLPLRFDNAEGEINFMSLLAALDFGDGWRASVALKTGRDFEELVVFALMSQHINGDPLDADSLANLSLFTLGNVLELPITEEVEVAPAIRQDMASEHKELVERYHATLQNISLRLKETGFSSLGRFVLHPDAAHGTVAPDWSSNQSANESAASLIVRLSGVFRCFADSPVHPDFAERPLPFHRKAAILAQRLQKRFPAILPLPGAEAFYAGADLPTLRLMRRKGLVKLSNGLRASLATQPVLPANSSTEVVLRASAMFAVGKFTKALTSRTGREVPSTVALAFLAQLKDEGPGSICEKDDRRVEIAPSCRDTIHY